MEPGAFHTIILLSIDSLRFDCVSYQEQKMIDRQYLHFLKTRTLDRLQKHAVCFTRAYSTSTSTPPAHASLFTGLYPPQHKVRQFCYQGMVLPKQVKTLASTLKSMGYGTAACVDFKSVFGFTNLLRGFDYVAYKDSDFVRMLTMLQRKNKFFLFLHFGDVHAPYLHSFSDIYASNDDFYQLMVKRAKKVGVTEDKIFIRKQDTYELWQKALSEGWVTQNRSDLFPLYLKSVSKFDAGRLHRYIQLFYRTFNMTNSVIFLLSDHGEGQTDISNPGGFFHAGHLAEEVIRIPLIVHSPKFKFAKNTNLLSLKDVYDLILFSARGILQKDVVNFSNRDHSVYTEMWQSYDATPRQTLGQFFSALVKTRVSSYYLSERAVITEQFKLIVWLKPEFLINRLRTLSIRLHIKRSEFQDIFLHLGYPPRIYRWLVYFMSILPSFGSKHLARIVLKTVRSPIFMFQVLNHGHNKHSLIFNNDAVGVKTSYEKIFNLFLLLFRMSRVNVSRENLRLFFDLLQ